MLSNNRKILLKYSAMLIIMGICNIRAQDTITFNDGMFATGAVKSVTADSVKLTASFTKEVVAVPAERVGAVLLQGKRYTFNKEYGVWENGSADALNDYFTQITLGEDREISVLKYRGSLHMRNSSVFSSVLDSVYRANFYEVRYNSYNFELSGEIVSNIQQIEHPLQKTVLLMENPYPSGVGNVVWGFFFLGWGIAFTNIGLAGAALAGLQDEVVEILCLGGGMFCVATISLKIGMKKKKLHEEWDNKYEAQNTP